MELLSTHNDISLLECDDIMYVRPVGQCSIEIPEDIPIEGVTDDVSVNDIPDGDPLVALLDGMPLTGHKNLDQRLKVDDPDGFESAYQAHERVHGTAMSSLICLGDMNEAGLPIHRKLYVRPVMKPRRDFNGQAHEAIPPDVLPVDLIYRAVRRMYEGENGEPPVAPTVRVVNLSICDPLRPFANGMSSLARLLDWLSFKYGVLFMVSAGNNAQDIELDAPRADLNHMSADQIESAVIESVAKDTRNRRLLSPSETLNGITIGAIHSDASTPPVTRWIDPFTRSGLPSVISGHGPGYRRAIKPDLLLPGGRQLLVEKLGNSHANAILEVVKSTRSPGQLAATPGPQGQLNGTRFTRGTSNATALASRATHYIYDVISELRDISSLVSNTDYDAVLIKALLAHGATWDNAYSTYASPLRSLRQGRQLREYIGRFLGYGEVQLERVLTCTDQRVTALGVGQLLDGEADEFAFPLPPSLSSMSAKRRLTITLAWLTPVNIAHQSYRVAQLWYQPKERNNIAVARLYANDRAVQRGTLQHEILEGSAATPFQDGESIGIKLNCRADAGQIPIPIRYCVAVTLEVMDDIGIQIYDEVRNRIATRISIRT